MNSRKVAQISIIFLFLLGWVIFIFTDRYTHRQYTQDQQAKSINRSSEHAAAREEMNGEIENKQPENTEDMISKKIESKNTIEDLQSLETIYNQDKSPVILKKIIEKQAQNYDFNNALENISKLKESGEDIDAGIYLYVYINSNNININQPESIKSIIPLIETYNPDNKLGTEDYNFYQGLIAIRNKNYQTAIENRKSIQDPKYTTIIQSFEKAIYSYDASKAIPPYYQDGLVALAALKNGYFTIARKIALETVLKNEKYILPYQILAYSHFLTNNRDTAIEYFLKLADVDEVNKSMYKLLIGISYYRKHDYASSILYLGQANAPETRTDQLRYMILNYINLQDNTKLNISRQKLLGQSDINPSDFYLYFYTIFYKAYFSQDVSLYTQNTQLPGLFINKCEETFSGTNDICIYGKIGEALLTNTIQTKEADLIKLANTYKQSYLYHILGDYYSMNKHDAIQAKENYIKALGLTQDPNEKEIINQKITKL